MMRSVRCVFVLLAMWETAAAHAQPLRFDRIGMEDGLPDNTVYDMLQDRRGFLWLASEGGLVRYDGYTFTTYRFDPSDPHTLSTNVLVSLYEDRDGMLWVGTNRGGINRFDPATGHVVRYPLPDPAAWVGQMEEDRNGGLWAIALRNTMRARLYHLRRDSTAFTRVGLPVDAAAPFLFARRGYVWTAPEPGRVHRLDLATGDGRTYAVPASEAAAPQLAEDQEGMIWICDGDALHRLDPKTGRTTSYTVPGLRALPIGWRRIIFLEDVLWLASNAGLIGVDLREGRIMQHQSVPNDPHSLTRDDIASIFADRSGIMWLGLLNAGICRVVPWRQQFHHYYHVPGRPGGLAGNHVVDVFEDAAGRLYVSTSAGGLQRLEEAAGVFETVPVGWERYTGGKVPQVRSMYEDRDGGRWYGTWGDGLFYAEPRTGRLRHYRFGPTTDDGAIRVLFEDRRGTFWVGTETGLLRYDRTRDRFEPFPTPDYGPSALAGAAVWAMTDDRKGRLWVATYGSGLFMIDTFAREVRRFRHDAADRRSLSSEDVSALLEDREGRLWVGTYGGGLNRWEPEAGAFTRYTSAEGFPDPYVHAVLEDGSGELWISTNGGLVRYTPVADTFRTYQAEDGLQSNWFVPGVALRRRDGTFVFGGINGFNWFDPARIDDSRYAPPVAVTSFSVRGRAVALDSLLVREGVVRIPWAQNEFAFELAALDFSAPDRNQYAHRLDGYDDTWRYTGVRRYGSYANLAPGRYVLRVKGAGSAGRWSEQEVAVPLYVVPPFWMTTWFRMLAGLAGFVLVAAAARYAATRKLRRQLQQLEVERRLQAERDRISRDLHDHVGAQLTYIIASLDLNTRQLAVMGASTQQQQLQGLRHHARMTMRQLRETIWALRQESVTVAGLAERLEAYAAQLTQDLGEPRLHMTDAVAVDVVLSPSQALNVFRIAQEALTNALKHAQAHNLYVQVRTEGVARLVVEVEDDGVGIGDVPQDETSGYGLANMRRRADELKGFLSIDARPGGGTRVLLVVPL